MATQTASKYVELTTLGGTEVAEIIATLAKVSKNVNTDALMRLITRETESCYAWATLLDSLMQDTSIGQVYTPNGKAEINPKVFDKVARKLNDGKTILIFLKQTQGGDHAFAIEPLGGAKARILHGWQGSHPFRPEQSMPIEELCDTLKSLTKLEHNTRDKPKLEKALCKLFGKDHARLGDNAARPKISFTSISEGVPRESLTSPANRARLRGLSEVIAPPERARLGGRSTVSLDDLAEAGGKGNKLSSIRMGTAFGAGLGFVLGAGGALYSGEDWEDVGLAGLKAGLGGGVAGGVATGIIKGTTPTFAKAGASIVRSNAAAGIALFGVFAIWDVAEWKMHKITGVQLRKRLAEGAGAAGGGILGGAAAGVAGGIWFGPVGAGVGAFFGGLVGGIGGMFAGKGIDYAIWDEGEDAVMNSYEFFGWHDVDRGERPEMTPEEMGEAYEEKLKNKPEKMEQKDWNNVCLGTFMILVKAMYPVFQELLELANEVRGKKSNGLSVIASLVFEQSQIKEE